MDIDALTEEQRQEQQQLEYETFLQDYTDATLEGDALGMA